MEFCREHGPIPAWPSAWLAARLSLSALQLIAALMGGRGSSVGPSIPVARLTDTPEAHTPKLLPVVHREAEGCGEVSQSPGQGHPRGVCAPLGMQQGRAWGGREGQFYYLSEPTISLSLRHQVRWTFGHCLATWGPKHYWFSLSIIAVIQGKECKVLENITP